VIEDGLGFKVVKVVAAHDEMLALAATLPIARGDLRCCREDVS
jgi:hypothetical protein